MANFNESVFNAPNAKRAMIIHNERLKLAESKLQAKGKTMSLERKLATAQCLENTRRQIKALEAFNYSGATQASAIGQYKRFALDMVGALIPNIVAPDIVGVQAIDNRVGMINILEYQYGSNKGQAKEGQVFNSPLANASGVIADYSSAQVVKETLGADLKPQWTPVVGTVYNVTKGAAANVKEDGTVEGASNNDIITYMYDNETVPVEAPEIKLNIRSLPVETRSRKLKALWSFDAAYELDKELN